MATEYSIQKMVSDGTLSTIALGIQYLQRNDIYIRIAGEETPTVRPSGRLVIGVPRRSSEFWVDTISIVFDF